MAQTVARLWGSVAFFARLEGAKLSASWAKHPGVKCFCGTQACAALAEAQCKMEAACYIIDGQFLAGAA